MQISLRELKKHLSKYLVLVNNSTTVIGTSHNSISQHDVTQIPGMRWNFSNKEDVYEAFSSI